MKLPPSRVTASRHDADDHSAVYAVPSRRMRRNPFYLSLAASLPLECSKVYNVV
jgi:hypothetical protein